MITINTPLKAEAFRKVAEEEGLVFVQKKGMSMEFENPKGDDVATAAALKKKFKSIRELSAIYCQVNAT